jgi:hypothetical protein
MAYWEGIIDQLIQLREWHKERDTFHSQKVKDGISSHSLLPQLNSSLFSNLLPPQALLFWSLVAGLRYKAD